MTVPVPVAMEYVFVTGERPGFRRAGGRPDPCLAFEGEELSILYRSYQPDRALHVATGRGTVWWYSYSRGLHLHVHIEARTSGFTCSH